MLKKQEGITLVALVITIIVLLILAGVTISLLFNDESGILKRATEAGQNYTNAAAEENTTIQGIENYIENYLKKINPTT